MAKKPKDVTLDELTDLMLKLGNNRRIPMEVLTGFCGVAFAAGIIHSGCADHAEQHIEELENVIRDFLNPVIH